MSTSRTLWGLKIYLNAEYTQDTTIGLYTTGGVSWFRWIESAMSGTSVAFKEGIILPNGIPAIEESGDFRRGGAFIAVNPIIVQLCNTAKFYSELDALGIGINGLKCEVIEFVQNVATSVITETVRGYFKASIKDWSVKNYELPLEPAVFDRNAQMGTMIDIENYPNADESDVGKMIPMTFGELSQYPARLVCTEKKDTIYSSKTLAGYVKSGSGFANVSPDVTAWPIVFVPEYTITYTPISGTFQDGEYVTSTGGPFGSGSGYIARDNGAGQMTVYDYDTMSILQTITGSLSGATGQITAVTSINAVTSPNLDYVIDIANVDPGGLAGVQTPTDMFLCVLEGDMSGQARQIEKIINRSGTGTRYLIQLSSYFEKNLVSSSDADENWVQIKYQLRSHQADVWKCKKFLDSDAGEIDETVDTPFADVFSYEELSSAYVKATGTETSPEKINILKSNSDYYLLPSSAFLINGSNNNKITVQVKMYDGSIDTLTCFQQKAIVLPELIGYTSDLAYWFNTGDTICGIDRDVWTRYIDGVFRYSAEAAHITFVPDNDSANLPKIIDKTVDSWNPSATMSMFGHGSTYNDAVLFAVKFNLPDKPKFTYDEIYFCGHVDMAYTEAVSNYGAFKIVDMLFRTRRFKNGLANAIQLTQDISSVSGSLATQTIRNLPDSYFITSPATKDVYFYFPIDVVSTTDNILQGYKNAEVSMIDNMYEMLYECAIFIAGKIRYQATGDSTTGVLSSNIYEAMLLFRKKISIGNSIFTKIKGRIFNDTWGVRTSGNSPKVAADMMTTFVDFYEHACRLQNWSAEGDTSVIYGKAYSASALINTASTDGGFDSPRLDSVKAMLPAFQILDADKSWTKAFKDEILQSTFCAGYIDDSGQECLAYLPKTSATITDTVTLADVPDGMYPGTVEEPKPEDVYCEPFVRFAWDEGAQKYNGFLAIQNVHIDGGWIAGYTPGFNSGEGEYFWNRCHDELWSRYHQIEKPPSNLTDRPMISLYADAKQYLTTLIDMMLIRRVSWPVFYEKGKTWHVGRHIYITHPHITSGAQLEAIIEGITKNKNGGYCELSLAFWVEEPAEYYYKDTMTKQADGADYDWKDTTDTANPEYKNQM